MGMSSLWNWPFEFVLQRVQAIHWVFPLACVLGVSMVYVLDLDVKNFGSKVLEGETNPQKVKAGSIVAPTEEAITNASFPERYLYYMNEAVKSIQSGDFVSKIYAFVSITQFVWAAVWIKWKATSKNHFSYLMGKYALDIPITPNESMVKSYLDVKRKLGSRGAFPFMWKVSCIKDVQVECEGDKCIPMSSYSYLDLLRNEEVQESAIAAAREYSTGNHGPRMLGGNMRILVELEQVVSDWFGRDGSLLCATGFLACMSAVCAVSHERDVIFTDSRAHASLRAGMKLSGSKILNFKHNDYAHAEKLMLKHRRKFDNAWMIIESVYSMDGDIADLPAAVALCEKYDIKIILDEAHGLGVLGKTGRGLEEYYDMPGAATIICGTFSKSAAGIGGFICGDKDIIDFMDFHAPGNVFSAPLPAYCAGGVIKAFELFERESWRIAKAKDNALYLREALQSGLGLWPPNYPDADKYVIEGDADTTVIPVVFPDDIERTVRISGALKKHGFMLAAVMYPACPLRRPRFRVTATTAYTKEIMDAFVTTLVAVCVEEPPYELREHLKKAFS